MDGRRMVIGDVNGEMAIPVPAPSHQREAVVSARYEGTVAAQYHVIRPGSTRPPTKPFLHMLPSRARIADAEITPAELAACLAS